MQVALMMKNELAKRKNYAFGAAAGAVAGFPVGILEAVASGPSPYSFILWLVISIFVSATNGIISGAIFIWVRDKIPTKRILSKVIIFCLLLELVRLGFGTVIWISFPRIPFPLEHALMGLGLFLLWGVVFGYLLEHPKLVKRLDVLHP